MENERTKLSNFTRLETYISDDRVTINANFPMKKKKGKKYSEYRIRNAKLLTVSRKIRILIFELAD